MTSTATGRIAARARKRVLVVDSEPVFSLGLATILSRSPHLEVIGHASTGAEARSFLSSIDADLVSVDITLDDIDGVELLKKIRNETSSRNFVILTSCSNPLDVGRAMAAGARSYLLKRSPIPEILYAFSTVAEGGTFLPPSAARLLANQPIGKALTKRESELLILVSRGHTYEQMALMLGVQIETIKTHMKHLKLKFGKKSRAEIVAASLKQGLIDVSHL